MLPEIQKLIAKANIFSHHNQGILVARVQDTSQGFELAKEILYGTTNKNALLYLSGGRTPKDLYKKLAEEEKLEVGAVGLVDERYGAKWHENSNEKMLKDTGLLRYLQMRDIKFYPILQRHSELFSHSEHSEESLDASATPQHDKFRVEAAMAYDQKLRELNTLYQKSIGILGVGVDGHTAGIPARSEKLKAQSAKLYDTLDLVTDYYDEEGFYGQRITMTFLGLSMLDLNIVLVFGDDKKEALDLMFADGSEEEIPSRFFRRPDIATKTVLITDQNV